VSNNGKPAPVRANELDNIRVLMRSLSVTDGVLERVVLQPGLAVRVTKGPFSGIEGVIIEQRNSRKFIVQLTTIGEGLVVNVDDRLLEAIGDESSRILSV
jgi:transcription antitermination factor NusG